MRRCGLSRSWSNVTSRCGPHSPRLTTGRGPRIAALDAATDSRVLLHGVSEAERLAEVRRYAREEARRPFDLASGPLVRATLIELAAEDHVLVVTMHHIISDGWSCGAARRSEALYEAFIVLAGGGDSCCRRFPSSIADLRAWQWNGCRGTCSTHQLAYWRERLRDSPAVLDLPIDHPRPPAQKLPGGQSSPSGLSVGRQAFAASDARGRAHAVHDAARVI